MSGFDREMWRTARNELEQIFTARRYA